MPRSIASHALWLTLVLIASPVRSQTSPPPASPVQPDAEPKWFKGNLHTHSLWSDGDDYPEMIVDWYVRQGYQFLAISDHNVLGQNLRWLSVKAANARARHDGFARYRARFGDHWVETRTDDDGDLLVRLKPLGEYRTLFEQPGRFLLVAGEEITDAFQSKPIHMNASNVAELIKPQGGNSVSEVMANNLAAIEEQAKRLGRPILGHLNHPNFGYGVTAEELAMVTRERFFEIYNGHPDVHLLGDEHHASVDRMWDIINTLRIGEMNAAPVYGLGTDDSHHYFDGSSSPGRGWIMVRSRFLTPESLIKGIEEGDFYASSGVTLRDVRYDAEAGALGVEIEPEPGVKYTTQFLGTLKGYDRTRKPVQDQDGKPLPLTQRYSDDVGRVLATVEGTSASYRLTGEELYVRAIVTSDKPPANPAYPGQTSQAWTQPVGWQAHLKAAGDAAAK